MDPTELAEAARRVLPAATWSYLQGTAGPARDADRDERSWCEIDLVPRVLRGRPGTDTGADLGDRLPHPVLVAPTAAHGLVHPDGELATAAGAAAAGALMIYSSSATVEVSRFGAGTTSPWWAQVYLLTDRGRSRDYLDRLVAAGAGAVVLTVDYPGPIAAAPFRSGGGALPVTPGNYPGLSWAQMTAMVDPDLTLDVIGEVAAHTGLPVYVKGILHPDDAAAAVGAGAAGIIVSNHGRRQLPGVVPVAAVLPAVVRAVSGQVPVLVDGGIRSGTDVLRALALGARAVGVGRPALWALAASGPDGVGRMLRLLVAQLRQATAAAGLRRSADATPDLLLGPAHR